MLCNEAPSEATVYLTALRELIKLSFSMPDDLDGMAVFVAVAEHASPALRALVDFCGGRGGSKEERGRW